LINEEERQEQRIKNNFITTQIQQKYFNSLMALTCSARVALQGNTD